MIKSEQIEFENDRLILKVKKPSLFVLILSFGMSFLFLLLPIIVLMAIMSTGDGENPLHFMHFVFLAIPFSFGVFLLRISLWNYYGKEVYNFGQKNLEYFADYNWFKDSVKSMKMSDLYFLFKIYNENDNVGQLLISDGQSEIESVIKLPVDDLEKLVNRLESKYLIIEEEFKL